MRIAAIDIGTNSTRLLVMEKKEKGLERIHSEIKTTRIGEGINNGRIQAQPMNRTIAALQLLKEKALELGSEKIIIAATSAVRDAENRQEFIDKAEDIIGCEIKIIPGNLEAELSYLGVVKDLFPTEDKSIAVLDIGGGSTEIVWTNSEGNLRCTSSQVGAVRMTEGNNNNQEIKALLTPVLNETREKSFTRLIGVGGTVTTLASIAQKLEVYDWRKVHGYSISIQQIKEIYCDLAAMDRNAREKVIGLQKERADIILAGISILIIIMEELGHNSLLVSESDLLQGMIYYYN